MNSLLVPEPQKCKICNRAAYCHNYGVLTCDACKMFFRRVTLLNVQYTCRRTGRCLDSSTSSAPNCRFCRFQKCLSVGMSFHSHRVLDVNDKKNSEMATLISQLMYKDTRRSNSLLKKFSFEDPSTYEMVTGKRLNTPIRDSNHIMTPDQWNFFYAFTTIQFLLSLDFMSLLDPNDKTILIKNFTIKASFLFKSLRSMREKSDKVITPDGEDVVPKHLIGIFDCSPLFFCRVRSLLISKLIELNIQNEEFILLVVILFCNPALSSLSDCGRKVVTRQQKIYSNTLLQHCLLNCQREGPSRFTDLLSLCHVIDRHYQNVQYMTMMFQLKMPHHKLYRLIAEIGNDEQL